MKNTKRTLIGAAIIVALSGCSSLHTPQFEEDQDVVEKMVDKGFDGDVNEKAKLTRYPIGKVVYGNKYHNVNDYSFVETDERNLPSQYDDEIFIKDAEKSYTLDEFSAMLYKEFGIILDVSSPDLEILAQNEKEERPLAGNILQPTLIQQGIASDAASDYGLKSPPEAAKNEVADRDGLTLKPFKFDGTVRAMLDYVSLLNGVKWKYDPEFKRAYLYAYETREFMVYDFSSQSKSETTITTTSKQDSESTTGGSSKSFSRSGDVKPWDEVTKSINSMIADAPYASASFNEKTGLILVKANDYTLSRIHSYTKKLNDLTTTEVTVQFRMIRMRYSESDIAQVNASVLNSGLESSSLGSYSLAGGAGSFSSSMTSGLSTFQELVGGNYLSLANDSFEMLMGYLNSIGTAKLSYETQVSTPNNEITTHQGGTNEEYISGITSSSSSSDDDDTDDITTETDVAVDGVSMTLHPRIIGDQIIVEYSISNSDLIALNDAGLTNGLEGIKLREDTSLNLDSTALLENGIPSVIKIIHEGEVSTDAQGPIDEALWFLGGSQNRSKSHSSIIITMTAFYNSK